MRIRRHLTMVCLILASVSCGGDDPPPTAPSSPPTPVALTIVATAPSIGVGESQQLRAVITYSDGSGVPAADVSWRSSNDAVYAVWPGGLVVAMAPGAATISATSPPFTASTTLTAERRDGDLRRIQGRVIDFASEAGLPGVSVAFSRDVNVMEFQTTTDASGAFGIDLPPGRLTAVVGGQVAGNLAVRIGGPAYRGDLVANGGANCASRYGAVTDAMTFQPIAGVAIRLGSGQAVTGPDGWYRIDFACVYDPFNNSNTALIYASHPGYREFSRVVGRGIHGIHRLDMELQRP